MNDELFTTNNIIKQAIILFYNLLRKRLQRYVKLGTWNIMFNKYF